MAEKDKIFQGLNCIEGEITKYVDILFVVVTYKGV